MRLDRFTEDDIAPFLILAEGEGWLCDRWELCFLLQNFPQGCLVLRGSNGGPIACITSISYGRSGWIGNLIVEQKARRRGIGLGMMQAAVSQLTQAGVKTIWLTASEQGGALYRKLGFHQIDRINRWSGRGKCKRGFGKTEDEEPLRTLDQAGWGECRESLLVDVVRRGEVVTVPGGFLCSQQWGVGTQLGPFCCQGPTEAGLLLDHTLGEGSEKLFLDVPAANSAAAALLRERGFAVTGTTLLMYFGEPPSYRPDKIFALATMGSSG